MMAIKNTTVAVAFLVALNSASAVADMRPASLWDFITVMHSSLADISVATLKRAPLKFHLISQNEYINFYGADDVAFAAAGRATDIELRLSRDPQEKTLLWISHWQGPCLTLSEIKKHYPTLTITDTPRGHSENEVTSYTTPAGASGEAVTFSFTVKVPYCLSDVIISRGA
ncbi:hypothetical protein FZI19_16750 [Cronobacter muytjensii]|uniref:Uncharacterized protein n=2 Tax=Cronobacter muytjensii TaxID=413501 RepID=A0A2T7AKX9_9ENTR|nr:hypothetical protein [Cronobacter muytjensii]KAB0874885.1 hypothetical protein FZI19_16750 [Cronobacter muytjensii]MBF4813591.1 hypothetical protein [Cronobacter muytjensii]PUX09390.1 hypothetical protein AUN14_18925 [Cronobacter muytjensii]